MADDKSKPLHILGVGAHLDDCWLGFGGTALKALRRGHRVTFVVAITNFRKLPYLAGRDAEIMAFLDKQAVVSAPTSPEEFAAFVAEDRKAADALIHLANTPRADYKPE